MPIVIMVVERRAIHSAAAIALVKFRAACAGMQMPAIGGAGYEAGTSLGCRSSAPLGLAG